MVIDSFINELSFYNNENVFNPWGENCSISDHKDSFLIRQSNLKEVLGACLKSGNVDLWIGRDLGWRGGRRTGISLVDEFSLMQYGELLGLNSLKKATIDNPVKERTASEIDLIIKEIKHPVFFWNAFPYHPHEARSAFTNRAHTKEELAIGLSFLKILVDTIKPNRIVSIGNDAAIAISKIGIKSLKVRHPSYGGQTQFRNQIRDIYGLDKDEAMKENIPLFV